ncbi:unnamed protein product [Brassica oleracea var. botrytis]|uniref:(rape) hypothetical protein n=1 Tax=Brassica napus TaxID=3708 RepID=A0A816IGY6_BRANA|nr:unnamed protein product [Brassica napus]
MVSRRRDPEIGEEEWIGIHKKLRIYLLESSNFCILDVYSRIYESLLS